MIVWRNIKNNRLYLLYENHQHYYGKITAQPYSWIGKVICNAKLKNFKPVAYR